MSHFNSFIGGLKEGRAALQHRQSEFNAAMMPEPAQAAQRPSIRQGETNRGGVQNTGAGHGGGGRRQLPLAAPRSGTQDLARTLAGLDPAKRIELKADLKRKGQIVAALSPLPPEQQVIGIQTYGKEFGIDDASLQKAASNPAMALAEVSSSIQQAEMILARLRPNRRPGNEQGDGIHSFHNPFDGKPIGVNVAETPAAQFDDLRRTQSETKNETLRELPSNVMTMAYDPGQLDGSVARQISFAENDPETRRGYSLERLLDQLFGAERTTIDSGEQVFDPQYGATKQKYEDIVLELSKSDNLTAASRALTDESINYLLEKGNVTPQARTVLTEFVNGEAPNVVPENAKPLTIYGIDLIGPATAGARSTIDNYISETNDRAGQEFLKKPHLRLYDGPTEALSELLTGNNGDYYKRQFSEAIKAFSTRDGGVISNGSNYTEFVSEDAGVSMLLGTIDQSLNGTVDLSDVVGTFTYGINIIASDDRLNFYVRNNSTVTSYTGANATGLELVREASPGNPLSAVSQIFTFSVPNPYLKKTP